MVKDIIISEVLFQPLMDEFMIVMLHATTPEGKLIAWPWPHKRSNPLTKESVKKDYNCVRGALLRAFNLCVGADFVVKTELSMSTAEVAEDEDEDEEND